jgi:type III secretion system low calcium response chaperone LcrH/SycD
MKKDHEDDFKISKKVRHKLKNREAIKKEIESGKSFQEILEFSDAAMSRFYHSANHLFENKRYPDAANAFLFLVTLEPHISRYWIGLGMSAQMCHDYEAAIDAYEMAAICEIENPEPYFYLAKCLFAVHDREATLQALDLAIEYAGDNDDYADLKRQAIAAKELLLKDL